MRKEEVFTKEMMGFIEEAESYLETLIREVKLCSSEIRRALERYRETKEVIFRINNEIFDLEKFLLTINKSLGFEIPVISIRNVFTDPEKRLILALKKIDKLRNYLHSMPGARLPEMSESINKLVIKETLIIRNI